MCNFTFHKQCVCLVVPKFGKYLTTLTVLLLLWRKWMKFLIAQNQVAEKCYRIGGGVEISVINSTNRCQLWTLQLVLFSAATAIVVPQPRQSPAEFPHCCAQSSVPQTDLLPEPRTWRCPWFSVPVPIARKDSAQTVLEQVSPSTRPLFLLRPVPPPLHRLMLVWNEIGKIYQNPLKCNPILWLGIAWRTSLLWSFSQFHK